MRDVQPARVLFIDPRDVVLQAVRARLPADTVIQSSDSVIRALRRIEAEPFDLVLCDIDVLDMGELLVGRAPTALLDGDKLIALAGMSAPASLIDLPTERQLPSVLALACA